MFFLAFIFIAYGIVQLVRAAFQHRKARRVPPEDPEPEPPPEDPDAVQALVVLGMKKREAERIVRFILHVNPKLTTEEVVKRAIHFK